jgi:polysaccharide export outer membrane protein
MKNNAMKKMLIMLFAISLTGLSFADELQQPIPVSEERSAQRPGVDATPYAGDHAAVESQSKMANMPVVMSEEYIIGAHDLLEISIFQSPDLSRTVRVNSRGEINLPLIGVVQAGGLSGYDLEKTIAERYSKKYLQNPQVGVFIKEYTSQKITVEGSVKKAGVFPITGRTTLLQVIAMASGFEAVADVETVRVYRLNADGTKETHTYNLTEIREGRVADPQVQGNDIVVVGESSGKAMLKGLTDTLRGFIGFGNPF